MGDMFLYIRTDHGKTAKTSIVSTEEIPSLQRDHHN